MIKSLNYLIVTCLGIGSIRYAPGTITSIESGENNSKLVTIQTEEGQSITETIPVGPKLLVKVQDNVVAGQPLTNDPNVGGFGQIDTEVVLQSPARVIGLLIFFMGVTLAQILLVLKKRYRGPSRS